ncbi:MAG: hypothetical protein ACP5C3_07080 [Methanomicrobiales archaeon]
MEYDDLSKEILFSMHRKGYYNQKHTPVNYVCKRLPKYSCKLVKKTIRNLIKESLIVPYKTKHGLDIYLNINKAKKIKKIIKPLEDEINQF